MNPKPLTDNREEDTLPHGGPSGTHPVDQVWGTLRLDRPIDEILDEMRGSAPEERVNSESSEVLTLTHRDWEAFLAAFDDTDRPRPRLAEAARRYLSQRDHDAESAGPTRDQSSHRPAE